MQLIDQPTHRIPRMRPELFTWLQAVRNAGGTWLQAGTRGLRKGAESASESRVRVENLAQVIADLELLNQNTEQDFLRIGGKLAEFIEAVNLISSQLAALADLNSGEQAVRASQALTRSLEHATEMKGRSAENNGVLDRMRKEAGRLKQVLWGFHGTVTIFQTLGVLTRIETARLGRVGADFGSLADAVNVLASHVQAKVQSGLDTADVLLPSIESALQNISGIEEAQANSLPGVISGVLASLSTFHSFCDSQEKMHAASICLAAQYSAILQAFKKVIVSIQFHDLTRQQVEHVIEVLRRLCSGSEREKGAATVLAIQSSQLADAGEKFAASVVSVERNLADIAELVLKMADESRTSSGHSEEEKNSFFSELEGGCTLLVERLAHCAATEAATRTTSSRLGEEIRGMRDSVEEILAMEIQMQRMALNAGIRAAHIGPSGDALGILAGSMQQQAFESRERSIALSEALGSMGQAAAHLAGHPASDSGGEEGYLEGVRTAVAELHASSKRTSVQLAQISVLGSRLREDLSATCENFTVGAVFAEAVSRARGRLLKIGERCPSVLPHADGETSDPGLTDFSQHYTMQSEHDVHQSATKAAIVAATTVPVEQSASTPNNAEEVGENIEFF